MMNITKFLILIYFIIRPEFCHSQQKNSNDIDSKVVVLKINNYSFVNVDQIEFLDESLESISKSKAKALIVEINCSGGLASELRNFTEKFVKLEIPKVAYVNGDASGPGAVIALSSDHIYVPSIDTVIGGEVKPVEWRGSSEMLPKRLTDLRYFDLVESFSGVFANTGLKKELILGICDIDREVTVSDEIISRSGDVLSFTSEDFKKLSISGGVAKSVSEIIELQNYNCDFIELTSPEVVIKEINQKRKRTKNEPKSVTVSDDEVIQEKSKIGKTKLESYKNKIVVIPVGMESLVRETKFDFMKRIIEKANTDGASAIIFDLNTPGGIAWYTEEIMLSDLQKISVPTYSYVNPKAMSAGALIAIATDYIYMHEPSTIGAAAPVMGNGQDIPEAMLKKVMSDILATADDVARLKGHDPQIAKAFVDSEIEIYFEIPVVSSEGNLTTENAFSPDDENDLLVLNAWQATQIIDGKPLFAEGLAESINDLVQKEGLSGDIVVAKPLGFEYVSDLIVKLAPWLLLFGIAGAYMELKAPGFGFPGFISLISFGLFFFGHNVAGYLAGYEIVGIFILGFILLILEFFVFPGLMILGLIGAVLIVGSLIYTMVDPLDLGWSGELNFSNFITVLSDPLMNLSLGLFGAVLISLLFVRFMNNIPILRGMVLSEGIESNNASDENLKDAKRHSLLGKSGKTLTDLKPSGSAMIEDEIVDVISDGEFIPKNTNIKVVTEEGVRVVVERSD